MFLSKIATGASSSAEINPRVMLDVTFADAMSTLCESAEFVGAMDMELMQSEFTVLQQSQLASESGDFSVANEAEESFFAKVKRKIKELIEWLKKVFTKVWNAVKNAISWVLSFITTNEKTLVRKKDQISGIVSGKYPVKKAFKQKSMAPGMKTAVADGEAALKELDAIDSKLKGVNEEAATKIREDIAKVVADLNAKFKDLGEAEKASEHKPEDGKALLKSNLDAFGRLRGDSKRIQGFQAGINAAGSDIKKQMASAKSVADKLGKDASQEDRDAAAAEILSLKLWLTLLAAKSQIISKTISIVAKAGRVYLYNIGAILSAAAKKEAAAAPAGGAAAPAGDGQAAGAANAMSFDF